MMLGWMYFAFVLLVTLLVVRTQNKMVATFLSVFAAYYYIGWFVANNMEFWQLNYYSSALLAMALGVAMGRLFINLGTQDNQPVDVDSVFSQPPNFYLKALVACLYGIGLCAYLALLVVYGVPILNISDRADTPGYFTYLIGVIWVLYPVLFLYLKKSHILPATVLTLLILGTMGYRTPLVITVLSFIFLNLKYQRFVITRKAKVFGALFLFIIASLYPLIRFQEDPQALISLLGNLDLPPELFILAPFILVFAEGASVILGIHLILPKIGIQLGAFTMSGFATVLPGEQIHSRTLLSYWLGRTNWQESSTTSSLLGQFLIEFGYLGSILCCFLLGVFLLIGSERYLKSNDRIKDLPFVFMFGLLLIGIHTGLLDPLVVYALLLYAMLFFADRVGGPLAKILQRRYQ